MASNDVVIDVISFERSLGIEERSAGGSQGKKRATKERRGNLVVGESELHGTLSSGISKSCMRTQTAIVVKVRDQLQALFCIRTCGTTWHTESSVDGNNQASGLDTR